MKIRKFLGGIYKKCI
ncbi:MAG: hypothetical protein II132_09880 [Desulfovibrio sp.]|nr:hypothetical protein [Desulfovibrio sp.]